MVRAMRLTREIQLGDPGRTNFYHVVSRTPGREILFGDREREAFARILRRQLRFSGLRALAWCFMGNHFHLLLEVPDKERALAGWTEEDFVDRLRVLKDELSTRMQLAEIAMFRENGNQAGIDRIAGRVRERVFDLSRFMKELKMKFTGAYNAMHGRTGTLWEGRFKSALVEGRRALEMVAAYIDLNPVRAGLARDPADYRWCGYAAAVAGDREARRGLTRAVRHREVRGARWAKTLASYRLLLHGVGGERSGGATVDGREAAKGGFTQREIEEVWKAGGRLPLAVALRCRVRYFTDGLVLGSAEFVDGFFERRRAGFSKGRKRGARRMKGGEWGEVRSFRDLQANPLSLPR